MLNMLGRAIDVRIFVGKIVGLTASTATIFVPHGHMQLIPLDQIVRILD